MFQVCPSGPPHQHCLALPFPVLIPFRFLVTTSHTRPAGQWIYFFCSLVLDKKKKQAESKFCPAGTAWSVTRHPTGKSHGVPLMHLTFTPYNLNLFTRRLGRGSRWCPGFHWDHQPGPFRHLVCLPRSAAARLRGSQLQPC